MQIGPIVLLLVLNTYTVSSLAHSWVDSHDIELESCAV